MVSANYRWRYMSWLGTFELIKYGSLFKSGNLSTFKLIKYGSLLKSGNLRKS